jgi:hypothetical protein
MAFVLGLVEMLLLGWSYIFPLDRLGGYVCTNLPIQSVLHKWINTKYTAIIVNHIRITVTRAFKCSCYMLHSLFETIGAPHIDNVAVRSWGPHSYSVDSLLICTVGIKCGVKWGKFRGIYCFGTTHFTVCCTVFPDLPALFQRSTPNKFWMESGRSYSLKTINLLPLFVTKPSCFRFNTPLKLL